MSDTEARWPTLAPPPPSGRRAGEGAGSATLAEARRTMEICNACRYCEGFCPVFPAMELRRAFSDGDLGYLANLCHNCKGCWHACQYAPPHEWGLNLPRAFADLRAETYGEHAWPRGFGRLFERNGMAVSLATALSLAAVMILTMLLQDQAALTASHTGPGAFYAVIPWEVMVTLGLAELTKSATLNLLVAHGTPPDRTIMCKIVESPIAPPERIGDHAGPVRRGR
ncbi:MAG: hypothetical protein IH797_07210 [Chloroflexi bacterium]|nr:hypothetical protein [Chloroflexota bacterium]